MGGKMGAAAAVLAATMLLTGCELNGNYATDVTQTSARLEAVGATGDAPAFYHFEYARSEADLGTAAGWRTPERGPIPPNTPSSETLTFGETVSGLSPGRLYFMRVCARRGAMTTDVCLAPREFFTRPSSAQDYVVGGYSPGLYGPWGRVQAAASVNGRDADGWVASGDRGTAFGGRVTCLRVKGNRAVVGAVGTYDDQTYDDYDPAVPYTALVTVVDDPAGERWDVARTPGSTPPDCRKATFNGFVPELSNLTVHDAP